MNTPATITAERKAAAAWRARHGIEPLDLAGFMRDLNRDVAERNAAATARYMATRTGPLPYALDADEQRAINVVGVLR